MPRWAKLRFEREQRFEARPQPTPAAIRFVEPCGEPVGDLAERRQQQVALVGEVVRHDGRAAPRRLGDVAERQRLESVGAHQLGCGAGDVTTP